jgi:hypothetical protein
MSRALTWCWLHERMPGNKFSSFLYANCVSTTLTVLITLKVSISFIVTLYSGNVQPLMAKGHKRYSELFRRPACKNHNKHYTIPPEALCSFFNHVTKQCGLGQTFGHPVYIKLAAEDRSPLWRRHYYNVAKYFPGRYGVISTKARIVSNSAVIT